jgi:hypothetical protein
MWVVSLEGTAHTTYNIFSTLDYLQLKRGTHTGMEGKKANDLETINEFYPRGQPVSIELDLSKCELWSTTLG